MDFKEKLEDLFGRQIDLLENQAIRNLQYSARFWTEKKDWFMTEKLLNTIYDVKLAIDDIESYFENEPRTYKNYQKNSLLKRAIERNLEL
jgi:hypothetical protein